MQHLMIRYSLLIIHLFFCLHKRNERNILDQNRIVVLVVTLVVLVCVVTSEEASEDTEEYYSHDCVG
jgi:hypothetical protein